MTLTTGHKSLPPQISHLKWFPWLQEQQISPISYYSPQVISRIAWATNLSHLRLLTTSNFHDCMRKKSLLSQITYFRWSPWQHEQQISSISDYILQVFSMTAWATNLIHLRLLTSSDLHDCMNNKSLLRQSTHLMWPWWLGNKPSSMTVQYKSRWHWMWFTGHLCLRYFLNN